MGGRRTLTPSAGVAATYTIILTLAPPILMLTVLPWLPAGRLLARLRARLRARTWGMLVVSVSALILGAETTRADAHCA